jgi:hypothetical protein
MQLLRSALTLSQANSFDATSNDFVIPSSFGAEDEEVGMKEERAISSNRYLEPQREARSERRVFHFRESILPFEPNIIPVSTSQPRCNSHGTPGALHPAPLLYPASATLYREKGRAL